MRIESFYPRLVVSDAAKAIDFYLEAFAALGAEEIERHTDDGRIVHAMLTVGGHRVAVKDEGHGDPAPTTVGSSPVIMALHVDDPDALGAAMERAGATVVYPVQDWDYGARGGRLADPHGHLWMIST